MCTDGPTLCFGPKQLVTTDNIVNPIRVSFDELSGGEPLVRTRLIDVQWTLQVGVMGSPPSADLTITNVGFH